MGVIKRLFDSYLEWNNSKKTSPNLENQTKEVFICESCWKQYVNLNDVKRFGDCVECGNFDVGREYDPTLLFKR